MSDFKWKNNGAIKLLIIVGTRPEIIRLAATIKRCREYFDCCVAHTGQNYDKNLIVGLPVQAIFAIEDTFIGHQYLK